MNKIQFDRSRTLDNPPVEYGVPYIVFFENDPEIKLIATKSTSKGIPIHTIYIANTYFNDDNIIYNNEKVTINNDKSTKLSYVIVSELTDSDILALNKTQKQTVMRMIYKAIKMVDKTRNLRYLIIEPRE